MIRCHHYFYIFQATVFMFSDLDWNCIIKWSIFIHNFNHITHSVVKRWQFFKDHMVCFVTNLKTTQGVLAIKFPISIQTQIQGKHRYQKVQKTLKNHVPVSNFATMLLDSRKVQKSQKFCKKKIFFCKKIGIWYQRNTFQDIFFHPWYLHSRKYIFDLNLTIKGSIIMKWGHGCKIWD